LPFRTRPGQPRDLRALVDAEIRERIEDAVDHGVLDIMVEARRRRGQPAPAADSPSDRAEFEAEVRALLEHLAAHLEPALDARQRDQAEEAVVRAGRDPMSRLLARQIALAKTLPDYWQRFDSARQAYAAERLRSGSQRRGLLGRLLSG
jgi:hypothetical protein